MNKYKAKKTVEDGLIFDSQAEARRYWKLKAREIVGDISSLERQCSYVLAPSVHLNGDKRKKPALRYVADFRYIKDGQEVVEDVKGFVTPLFRVKQHLMKSVHGIDIEVIRT